MPYAGRVLELNLRLYGILLRVVCAECVNEVLGQATCNLKALRVRRDNRDV